MSIFKSKSKEEKELEEKIKEKSLNLDKFPGSLEEYNSLKGIEYVIMDTGRPQKFIDLGYENEVKNLVKNGCEGFIHFTIAGTYDAIRYGIPVKRKNPDQ